MTKLTSKEIGMYINNYTSKSTPECSSCNKFAEYYDVGDGEIYCCMCLIDSLNRDPAIVRKMLDIVKDKEGSEK